MRRSWSAPQTWHCTYARRHLASRAGLGSPGAALPPRRVSIPHGGRPVADPLPVAAAVGVQQATRAELLVCRHDCLRIRASRTHAKEQQQHYCSHFSRAPRPPRFPGLTLRCVSCRSRYHRPGSLFPSRSSYSTTTTAIPSLPRTWLLSPTLHAAALARLDRARTDRSHRGCLHRGRRRRRRRPPRLTAAVHLHALRPGPGLVQQHLASGESVAFTRRALHPACVLQFIVTQPPGHPRRPSWTATIIPTTPTANSNLISGIPISRPMAIIDRRIK